MIDVRKLNLLLLEPCEGESRGDSLAVRGLLRRIGLLLGAVHEADLCRAASAPAARDSRRYRCLFGALAALQRQAAGCL